MRRYSNVWIDKPVALGGTGAPINAMTLEIRHPGTVVKANLFSDEGITVLGNPVTSDDFGRTGFYVGDGIYDFYLLKAGVIDTTISSVAIVDPRRVVEVTLNDDVYVGLVNARYNQNGGIFERASTTKPAWAHRYAGSSNDFLGVVHAVAAANPITWDEIFRYFNIRGSTALTPVVNTVAEGDLLALTIPVNGLGAKNGARLVMIGDYLNNSGAGSNLTLQVKLGATTLVTTGAVAMAASATRRRILVVVELYPRGATNSQAAYVQIFVSAPTADGVMESLTAQTIQLVGWHLNIAEDLTVAKTLKITATHSVAAATIDARHLSSRITPVGMAA